MAALRASRVLSSLSVLSFLLLISSSHPLFLILQTTMTTTVSRFSLLLVLVACLGWAAGQDTNYCKFTPEHTLCKFSGVGRRCGSQVRGRGVSSRSAATIVAMHNQLRAQVARGEESRGAPGPQPSAANMRTLVSVSNLMLICISIQASRISWYSMTPPRRGRGT